MTKTVLFLGGSNQQLAPIEYARRAGYRVITCDNRPESPGHVLADRYHDVSTTDMAGVLRVAREERVDAVVCYASDVSAPTAAYVAEQLQLPGNPLASVRTLTDKAQFRQFQAAHGYFVPRHLAFAEAQLTDEAAASATVAEALRLPVIVKPVDASGSKGVTKVRRPEELVPAMRNAVGYSLTRTVIVEELIVAEGYQVCGEGFLQDGQIVFQAFANEHFCPDIVVPVGESFPSMFDDAQVAKGVDVLQSIFSRLGMRQGPFNFDLMFTPEGEVFVIEIGPRNGGNRMPEAIRYATGVDTIAATVEGALGLSFDLSKRTNFFYATYSVHAKRDGTLTAIHYAPEIRARIVDELTFVMPGQPVKRFNMGSLMLSNLILAFDTYAEMLSTLDHMDDYVTVDIEGA
ncbi:MAG: putative carbamoyl-phosphate-synthetase [Polyangiaceae bacterium]|nr:putative carbamoyl-phosphate-synthetase [Polyangiaceae bacterium]